MRLVIRNAAGPSSAMNTRAPKVRGTSPPAARRDERVSLVDRIQRDLPGPRCLILLPAEQQRTIRSNGPHREAAAVANRDDVSRLQPLELGKQRRGTWPVKISKQPVEPVVAVQPSAPVSELQEPRPYVLGPGVGDASDGHLVRRRRRQQVAFHRPGSVDIGRIPVIDPPANGIREKKREQQQRAGQQQQVGRQTQGDRCAAADQRPGERNEQQDARDDRRRAEQDTDREERGWTRDAKGRAAGRRRPLSTISSG